MDKQSESYCLLVAHELSRTGAPIALLDAARTLIKSNHFVVICSPFDGPLRKEFESAGCEVAILPELELVLTDPDYRSHTRMILPLAARADIVLINTIMPYRLIDLLGGFDIPILWWVHEGYRFSLPLLNLLPRAVGDNTTVLYSSKNNEGVLNRLGVQTSSSEHLSFGVKDEYVAPRRAGRDAFIFLCVGSICKIKGQDILLEAIPYIQNHTDQNFEVWFAGSENDDYTSSLLRNSIESGLPVRNIGLVSHEEIISYYQQIDCVVSPSRNDTGPIVIVEGMMMSIPCICTDKCGVAATMQSNVNGYVVPSEDSIALAQSMLDILSLSENERGSMGAKGRNTYLKHYSMEAFEENFTRIVNTRLIPAETQEQLERKNDELQNLKNEIQDIRNSKSYKIMEPLRRLNQSLHKE